MATWGYACYTPFLGYKPCLKEMGCASRNVAHVPTTLILGTLPSAHSKPQPVPVPVSCVPMFPSSNTHVGLKVRGGGGGMEQETIVCT